MSAAKELFKGEHMCVKCEKNAYYVQAKQPRCGRHSDKYLRKNMKENPATVAKKLQGYVDHAKSVEDAAEANRKEGKPGQIRLYRLQGAFAVKVPAETGWQSVLPNFKNKTGTKRKDGALSMGSLSPKSVGPIEHGQPDLPKSKNLENFHQGSKKFPNQSDAEFIKTRLELYKSTKPMRHNPFAVKQSDGRRMTPQYFVWRDKDGIEHHLDYVTSRQFYCNFLEQKIRDLPDFHKLRELRDAGTNLLICGFDAFTPSCSASLEDVYLDGSKPFGHELVIYTMLVEDDKSKWPWRNHKTFDF